VDGDIDVTRWPVEDGVANNSSNEKGGDLLMG
jgi:hypothetical protein